MTSLAKKFNYALISLFLIFCTLYHLVRVFFGFWVTNNKNFKLEIIFLVENYDVLFVNNLNFYTLILAAIFSLSLILFLLFQANILNLSFFPNATFDAEKYSPYECGFIPFRTERAQFDIKFYLIALLFLVFDVELMFLLPYSMSYYYLGFYGYIVFIIFFVVLVIGFLIEWSSGILTWKGAENSPTNVYKLSEENLKIQAKHHIYFRFVKRYI
jgi:NADH-quinone oxidoreductase subunit A